MKNENAKRKINLRAIAVTAIMGALGFVLMLLDFPLPFLIPSFIKLDFSEIPAIITSFAFGPLWGVMVCLVKNLIHLFISSTEGVGELSNFLLGAIYVATAGIIYKRSKNRKSAFIGALIGSVCMAVFGVITNYFIVYPAYVVLYGMPMEAIIGMYKAILPAADTLIKDLIIFNLPFTFAKGLIDTIICFLVYKRISRLIK